MINRFSMKGSALKALEGDTSDIGSPAVIKLVETMDTYFPDPVRDIDKPFLLHGTKLDFWHSQANYHLVLY